jgi:spermidine synthase
MFAAAGAFWLARTEKATAEIAEHAENNVKTNPGKKASALRAQRAPRLHSSQRPPQPRLAWAAVAASGFVALVCEVAWTRLLALVIGPTTYAFATMVAAFVIGLAIGSAAGARLARRSPQPACWLAAMLVVAAVAAPAAAWFAASRLPLMIASQVADPAAAFGPIVLRQALMVALLLLPMTFALGAAFPLALATAAAGVDTVGPDTARVYACNTLGAIAGALAGGFVLLPTFGLQNTFRITAMAGLVAGAAVWTAATVPLTASAKVRAKRAFGLVAAAVAGAAVLAAPAWDRELLSSGAYKYAPYLSAGDLETTLRAGQLEYYKEGAAATVSVRRLAGTLSLAIDGKIDASNGGDMLTQRLLGLLPVVLDQRPQGVHLQEICVIGLGSGVTLASALAAGTVRRADVVEISPEVVDASALFERENNKALRAEGVRLIVGDGRSHLLLTRQRYDVIVSEPSNPWMAGVAALFTREFFEAARARLKPDGLLCQWAHTYDISAEDLRSIVRTFAAVFPQGTMWLVGDGDLLLIGTAGTAIEPHLAALATYSDGALKPFELLSLYAGGPRELERFGGAAPIQIDDRLALEFSAPRGIYGRSDNDNTAAIRALSDAASRPPVVRAAFDAADDMSWSARGAMNLEAAAFATAYDDFRRAVALNSRNGVALRGLTDAAAGAGHRDEALAHLKSLAAAERTNLWAHIELSRVLASGGDFDGAVASAAEAMRLAPGSPEPAEQLASIYADAGDAEHLTTLADTLVARFPARDDSAYYHATALFMKGRAADAAEELRRLVAGNPRHAHGQNLLGAACATIGQPECARTAFEASLAANPHDAATYVNLGVFHLNAGDPVRAAGYFAEALTLDPASSSARNGLAQARQKP